VTILAFGIQHLAFSGIQHLAFSGIQHLAFSSIQHLAFSGNFAPPLDVLQEQGYCRLSTGGSE
jgi:hypothetical protein